MFSSISVFHAVGHSPFPVTFNIWYYSSQAFLIPFIFAKYTAEFAPSLPVGPGRTWHSTEKTFCGREAFSFPFNVKTFSFVVLSVDIKVFPLTRPNRSPPTPPPTGFPWVSSPLTCFLILLFTPSFEVFIPPVCQLETWFLFLSRWGPTSTSVT